MAETLWTGGPLLEQAPGVFPMGTDSVLLGHFAPCGPRDRILDLGTGSGILPLLLLGRCPEASVTALEKSPVACDLARRNMAQNGLTQQVQLILGDLRDHRTLLPAGGFDLTISNPPYFVQGAGYAAAKGLEEARGEGGCTIEELCQAAAWATRWGGRFCLVFRPERLADLLYSLRTWGLEPKRLRPVHHSPGRAAILLLLEARRGGKPGLRWEPDLYLRTESGQETAELREIYHRS